MVGSSSNRSSSPMSTRPNPNPNSRSNSQEKDGVGVRKSFSGYPIIKSSIISQQKGLIPNTPVNSPAEYARRSSFGRESGGLSFRDHEQKENERDYNIKPAARAKSPSIVTKGTKNFMSPTISAASKINPSPRKKVLGERNEAIRTSASLSDGKFHFFSTSSLDFDDESESKSVIERPPWSTTPMGFNKGVNEVHCKEPEKDEFRHQNSFGGVKVKAIEADLVVLSPDVPLNVSMSSEALPLSEMPKMVADQKPDAANSSPCTIAPLAANPSLPPYDPKNNYLSPRPQFLHYNPNWRSESYANQGIRLDDEFASESVSETENSSEVLSEGSLNDQEDAASSVGISPKEMSPSSVTKSTESEQLEEMVEAEYPKEMPPSALTNSTESEQLEEIVEAELEPSSRWFRNLKTVAVLLLFLLGCVSISLTFYPGMGTGLYRNEIISQIYSHPHMVTVVENLNDLVQNAKLWSAHSVDYVSQVLQTVREVDRFDSLSFVNLTAWQEEEDWGYMAKEFELAPYFERLDNEPQVETARNAEALEMQGYSEHQEDQSLKQMQIYTEPEDHEVYVVEAEVVKLDDSEAEELKEISIIKDEASTQMQSYLTPEYNDIPAGEAELIKADGSEPAEVTETSVVEYSDAVYPEMIEEASSAAELIKEDGSEPAEVTETSVIEYNDTVNPEMAEEALSTAEPESLVDEFKVDEPQGDVHLEDLKVEGELSLSPTQVPEVITTNQPLEIADTDSIPVDVVQPETNITSSVAETLETLVFKASSGNPQLLQASEKSSAPVAVAVTVVLMSLFAAFMYMKPKKASPLADQFTAETRKHKYTTSNVEQPSLCDTSSSWSGPVEVDMIGESCPSEMSSFQDTAYTKSTQKDGDEAQSLQKSSKRNYRRESLASSSSEYTMNSSYGSFTTYSIIHPKRGDNDVVTPVRRSSRIRSKVTSP